MADELKVGSIVQLMSGSPKMTVTSVGDSGGTLTAWTHWFDATGKEQHGYYPVGALKLAAEEAVSLRVQRG